MAFTDADRKLLDLEARFYRHAGAKDAAIRDELELTAVTFGQRLIQLRGEPRAWLYAPATMAKVERIVEARRGQASARRAS